MIYLLDNNVLSELWKPKPDSNVISWFFSVEWLLPVPVIAEIQEGAEAAPSPARRIEINTKLDKLIEQHPDRVLDFNADSARTWGRLKHSPEVKQIGRAHV